MLVGSGAAMVALGRAAGWRPWVTLCMAALNVGMATTVVAALRPQLLLFTFVPLAWACVYRILAAPRIRWYVVWLVLMSAAAANSHLFFVLTAVPLALVLAAPPGERRRIWAACIAVLAGWFLSPYALHWPDVFRLNFGYNALLVQPSPIVEFRPGFRPGLWLPFALAVAIIPWAMPRYGVTRRERVVYGALWVTGLVAFGYAARLLLCWWLMVLPGAAIAIQQLGASGHVRAPRLWVKLATYAATLGALVAIAIPMSAAWRAEGGAMTRRLPSAASAPIEPLLVWLDCHVKPGHGGRVYTTFNYGSYLAWRLPAYSASIDGRTIFPDSVAKPDALVSGLLSRPAYRVWSSADLAIVPRYFGVAAVLDTARIWTLAATAAMPARSADSVGLWVNRTWWTHAGRAPLGEHHAALPAHSNSTSGDLAGALCSDLSLP
jgi:hypothetical protein